MLSVAIGIPIGLIQALRRGSPLDHFLSLLSAIGLSVPVFWLGIVMILIFAVSLGVLPSAGVTGIAEDTLLIRLRHLILPAAVLATTVLPTVVRFMRSAAMDVLHEDYVRTAASKGLAPRVVLTRHVLRNALIPVVSAIGALVPRLLGGTVVTESVFSWPGMGRLALEAAQGRDYPLITGLTVVVAAIAVATTLLVDLAYTRIDPRIRLA
ncbi:MAG: ABC transporter permease [Candidatus Limnocylindria bacterium]